jgi:hypothetical protein
MLVLGIYISPVILYCIRRKHLNVYRDQICYCLKGVTRCVFLWQKSKQNQSKHNQVPFIIHNNMFRSICVILTVPMVVLQYVLKTEIVNPKMTENRSKHVVLYNKWWLVLFGRILFWFLSNIFTFCACGEVLFFEDRSDKNLTLYTRKPCAPPTPNPEQRCFFQDF